MVDLFIDVDAVRERQRDRDCTLARDCRNLRIALDMGADGLEPSLHLVAARLSMQDWRPLDLPHSSNSRDRYATWVPAR